jgi:hypothetical protein
MDPVRRIADAVLYEGYVLWPYRRSAMKNQRRWTFGGVYPERHSAEHPDDRPAMQAQVLVEGGPGTIVDVSVRFLHVVRRQVLDAGAPVEELESGGERFVTWDEATERELAVPVPGRIEIDIRAGGERDELGDGAAVERSWRELRGTLEARSEDLRDGLRRVTASVRNETPWEGTDRQDALRQTFCSTHLVLRARGGDFVSLTDPPEGLREEAGACENVGVWPVLVGDRSTMLASPIILSDHPEIAPESPGDLFDGGEIDQLLILNILSLTDEEKREMRDSDPRAREILERTERLSPDDLMRLHGAIRR